MLTKLTVKNLTWAVPRLRLFQYLSAWSTDNQAHFENLRDQDHMHRLSLSINQIC
jgi:hypothetical protein